MLDQQCIILLEQNSTTQASIVADHANNSAVQFRNCVFLTFGKAKLAQGGTTRIPGIRTTTATKASMAQYIRLAINPMPLADGSIKLYFKAGLEKQYCKYKQLPGQKDSDIPNVYDSLLAQMARYKKKTEVRNGIFIVTFTGKPEKDDMVQTLGMAFLAAYTLLTRDRAIQNGGMPQYLSWGQMCECVEPGQLNKVEAANRVILR